MNRFGFYYVPILNTRDSDYVVVEGDTLYKIAQKFGISLEELIKANDITSSAIYPNQVLVIPKAVGNGTIYFDEYVVRPNDTIEKIGLKLNVDPEKIVRYNDITKLVLEQKQSIKIPREYKTYQIQEQDTISSILDSTGMTLEELINANVNNWLKPGTTINVK